MRVTLEKAYEEDAQSLFDIQRAAFLPLLEKYQDYETSPAAEPIERLQSKIKGPQSDFFKILADGKMAGGICVKRKAETRFRISPIFVLPEYQGFGIAQEAIRQAELLFQEAEVWELSTLLEERRNCYLYEKLGYIKTGSLQKLTAQATLVHYQKAVAAPS